MKCGHWRNGWLSLLAGLLWVGVGVAAAPEATPQSRAAQRVPLDEIAAGMREKVRAVIDHPTLFSPGPAEAFGGQPELYNWLLDHPDRALLAWGRLGARCNKITDQGNNCFAWTDEHGSHVTWQTAYSNSSLRIWYAEGKVNPGLLLLPAVPVRIVVMMRHGTRAVNKERTLIYHQACVFFQTDSTAATLVARALGASAPRIAEHCLGQLEMFYSGLVWYLDQHPERAEKLLVEKESK